MIMIMSELVKIAYTRSRSGVETSELPGASSGSQEQSLWEEGVRLRGEGGWSKVFRCGCSIRERSCASS
jgi:hypothetical protein